MNLRAVIIVGIVAASLLWLLSGTRRHWTEDVQLEDGSIVVVERHVRFTETSALGGDAYNSVISNSTLRFTGDLAKLPTWSVPLLAHTLYKDAATQEWVVIAKTSSCDDWREHGMPNPPYWEYHLRNGAWVETPVSKASIGRKSNLLWRFQAQLPANHITVAQKDELQRAIRNFEQMSYAERTYRVVMPAYTKALDYC